MSTRSQNSKDNSPGIDLDLIRKLFKGRDIAKPYYHIRTKSNSLSSLEKKVLENIQKLTDFKFDQVTINYNNRMSKHRHANVGASQAILLGNFSGGALCIENGERFETKNTWFSFDGKQLHWVEPFEGERFSIILYNR